MMIVIQPKIATVRTHFPGLRVAVPVGAPFCVLRGGVHYTKDGSVYAVPTTYVWVDDLEAVRSRRHFVVHMCRHGDAMPFDNYVDGDKGWARILRDFIRELPSTHAVSQRLLKRDVLSCAPHDRLVGAFIQRGRPNYDTNPHIITENHVTDGMRIGGRILREEGYNKLRLGMPNAPR